jgi:cell division protein FtsL
MEGRFTEPMKCRRFFDFLTLCLLVCTVATAHHTVLTLLQDRINHAQPLAQTR